MGTSFVGIDACCPLCGSPILSVGHTGRVLEEDVHLIQLGPELDRGYTLCDSCAILADLPSDLTLN